ncbi:uncharacterized protein LOC103572360 [Microplitis demolitor]|uniref:uncharacterized protein LOC103572360 n=1 Tax=Microplitis demolitor TaxID=69319 RepID=UPI0004CD7141|nr:uncharacterized protein LOC103572360 [Microplitis demolitor]
MVSRNKQKEAAIAVKLEEPLTSESCSKIIIELIKYVLFQKQQIPFSFDTLMQLQARIKPTDKSFNNNKTLFNTLDNMTFQLSSQLHLSGCDIKEVVVIIGATTVSPKFSLKLELPRVILSSKKHAEHQHSFRKPLLTLMKSLVECPEFQEAMTVPLGLTNTFVLIQKSDTNNKSDYFLPKPQYNLPAHSGSCFTVKLYHDDDFILDCKCLSLVRIYHDQLENNVDSDDVEKIDRRDCIEAEASYFWYQSKEFVKGFKFLR